VPTSTLASQGTAGAGLPPKLDSKGQALLDLAKQVFTTQGVDVFATLDEVVLTVPLEKLPGVCRTLKEDERFAFDLLRLLTVVDWKDHLQVVYHAFSLAKRHKVMVKADIKDMEKPSAPSLTAVWKTADWYEREMHDLFGVVFDGHPDLKPLMLWEGFEGFPGRKSYPFHEYSEY
jgi:NADH-quinone oxidoreductase subunit C